MRLTILSLCLLFSFGINAQIQIDSIVSTDETCFGANDGTITIHTSGGTPPVLYDIGFGPQSTSSFSGLACGTYTCQVSDGLPSSDFGITNINCATSLSYSLSTTDVTFYGGCDGTADVSISGGTPPYTITYYDGTGTPIQSGTSTSIFSLCAGNYSVEVTDQNGCPSTGPGGTSSTSFVITEPPCTMFSTHSVSPPLCFGSCDGQVFLTTTGGSPPYLVNDPFTGGPDISYTSSYGWTGVCAGTYTLSIQDALGCFEFMVVDVIEPTAVVGSISTTDESTSGACDGEATATASGGTPGYAYNWHTCSGTLIGQTTPTATGLCAGIYYCEITDANGCQVNTACDTVSSGTAPCGVTSTYSTVDVSCFGACDGEVFLTTTGGTLPYTVNDPFTPGPDVSYTSAYGWNGVCPGTYTLLIEDAVGCSEFLVITITEPPALTGSISTVDESSAGACDGSATATGSGGTPVYNYNWYTCSGTLIGQTTATATGLCAGIYYCEITDVNGCQVNTVCDTVGSGSSPCSMVSSTGYNEPTCAGTCDGEVFLTTTGGTPPYIVSGPFTGSPMTYTSTTMLTGFCAGTYTLSIMDAGGCNDFVVVTITEPAPITYSTSITDETSTGSCDGSIDVTATGGVGSYLYSHDCGATFQASPTFTNLCAGNYFVQVVDANGCVSSCDTAMVSSGTAPCGMISTTSVTDVTCAGNCDGEVFLTTTGGTPPYIVNDPFTGGGSVTYTSVYGWNGICAGTYTLLIEDATGCTEIVIVTISEPSPLTQSFTTNDESSSGACDGSITVTGSGGTSPYQYSIDCGLTFQTSPFTGLCAGTYSVMTIDANGCVTACETAVVSSTGCTMVSTTSSISATCYNTCDGIIMVTTTAGTPPYIVNDPMGGAPITYTSTGTIANLCVGTYTLVVEDAAGCLESLIVSVNSPSPMSTFASSSSQPTAVGACDGEAIGTVTGGTPGYTYDWIDCSTGASTGQSGSNATGLCEGDYAMIATDVNGCADTSSCVAMIDPPMSTIEHEIALKAYPNPTNGKVYISMNRQPEGKLIITDLIGNQVYSISNLDQTLEVDFNQIGARSGSYIINYYSGSSVSTIKVSYLK